MTLISKISPTFVGFDESSACDWKKLRSIFDQVSKNYTTFCMSCLNSKLERTFTPSHLPFLFPNTVQFA